MKQVNSIEELVASGETDLKALADSGNSVAAEWLAKVESTKDTMMKLAWFGEMRVTLLQDARPDAQTLLKEMFPGK